jgi:exonuclease SbcC
MILTRIQIENYKNYQGSHDIDVPAHATIGVIGENGAGKTTLFEAIEWCLYSPRAISPSDVRPRGFTGHTTVTVFLESIDGTRQYIVERVLRRAPSATIYRVDPGGEIVPIVQGTRQVSDYVATRLIGLSHVAFTATFFTRQKELHLFGDHAPGKRREEVGRLLGLETIRTAQLSIISDRSKAASEARAMLAQYERECEGRDFAAEVAIATATIGERTTQLETAAAAISVTEAERTRAEDVLAKAQERREADARLAQDIGQHDQARENNEQRLERLVSEINRLEERGRERARLVPVAVRLATLQAQVAEQESVRVRFERRNELDRVLREGAQRHQQFNGTVRDLVNRIQLSEPVEGWGWTGDDTTKSVMGVTRLLRIVDALDPTDAERQERNLSAAHQAAMAHTESTTTLEHYREARARLEQDEAELLSNGEPGDRIPLLEREREQMLHERTTLHANRTTLESDRDRTRIILGNLQNQDFDDNCPTCGRPFSAGDSMVVAEALRERVDEMTRQISQCERDANAIDVKLAGLEVRRQEIFKEMEALNTLRRRIQKSENVIDNQQEAVEKSRSELTAALTAAGIESPPQPDQVARAEARSRELRSLRSSRATLASSLDMFHTLETQREKATNEHAALADIEFDPDAFRRMVSELQEADRAQVSIGHIENELARMPQLADERKQVDARLAELRIALEGLHRQRAALGFKATELTESQAALQSARESERSALQRFHQSQGALRDAEHQRDAVIREQQRLERLASTADARQSEADRLDFMSREFTEFERYAAGRKRPVLADYTSQLVRAITDGKYDRVDFDQDFGIIVFDGDDSESAYSVDTFSGGERDAITLAARIALSQMIGRQAVNPPGFLVLDEVFGSLDADRRAHLLDLLGAISGTFEDLRQVFIISHVDDVRTSPVLDELWRVESTADGSSSVNSLGPGAEIDSL